MSFDYLACAFRSYSACAVFRALKEQQQGTELIQPALCQVDLLGILAFHCSLCLQGKDWQVLSNPIIKSGARMQSVFHFSPLLIAYGATHLPKKEYPKTQYLLETLSYRLGEVILTLNIVATMVFGALGKRKFFFGSLSGYLVSWIIYSNALPYQMREEVKKVLFFVSSVLNLVFPVSQLVRIMTAIDMILNGLDFCSPYLFGQFGGCAGKGSGVPTLRDLHAIDSSMYPFYFGVNPDHLSFSSRKSYDSQPISPDGVLAIIDRLEAALLTVDFEPYKETLSAMLSQDEHWDSEQWTHQGLKTGEEISFMKEGVLIFLNRLKAKISAPLSANHLRIRKHAASDIQLSHLSSLEKIYRVLQGWDQESDKTDKITAHVLMQLGVNGASYCGSRLQELARALSKPLGIGLPLFSVLRDFQISIIREYTKEIRKEIRGIYPGFVQESMYGRDETPHFFNQFLFCLAGPLGINTHDLVDDETLDKCAVRIFRIFNARTIRAYNRRFHQRDYTAVKILHEVKKTIDLKDLKDSEDIDSEDLNAGNIRKSFVQEDVADLNLAFEFDGDGKTKIKDLGVLLYLIKNGVLTFYS